MSQMRADYTVQCKACRNANEKRSYQANKDSIKSQKLQHYHSSTKLVRQMQSDLLSEFDISDIRSIHAAMVLAKTSA